VKVALKKMLKEVVVVAEEQLLRDKAVWGSSSDLFSTR
jgi:hypothetical protein